MEKTTHPTRDDEVQELGSLISAISGILQQIPETARQLTHDSTDTLLSPKLGWRQALQLGGTRLRLNLSILKKKKLRFIFRKKVREQLTLQTALALDIGPSEQLYPIIEYRGDQSTAERSSQVEGLRLLWEPPPFMQVRPTPETLARVGLTTEQLARKGGLMVSIGAGTDVMSITRLDKYKKLRFRYTTGDTWVETKADNLPLETILGFHQALNAWVRKRGDIGRAYPIKVHNTAEVNRVLNTLFQVYIVANNSLVWSSTPTETDTSALDVLQPYYVLTQYESRVLLRLKDSGALAEVNDRESYQMEAHLRGLWERNRPVLRMRLSIPDFLIDGPLHQAFIDALDSHQDELGQKIGKSPAQLKLAFASARTEGSIFRVKRTKDWDLQMFLFPMPLGEPPLIFQGKFAVQEADTNPRVTYQQDSFESLLKAGADKPNKGVARYLVRLLVYLKKINDMVT